MALPAETMPTDVGAHGWVLVGSFFGGGALYWMPTKGTVAIGGTSGVHVSRDGKTIVGNARDGLGRENAAIWVGGTTWRLLGSFSPQAQACDGSYSSVFGASDDAKIVVGLAWNGCGVARAFRWEEATGVVSLGSLGGGSTRANGVSGDGHVAAGWEQDADGFHMGAKWTDGTEQLIKGSTGTRVGEAFSATHNGSMIIGKNCTPDQLTIDPTAWTWTADKGVQCFPVARPSWLPPRAYQAVMEVTSDDGSVIGGAYSAGLDSEALIWLDGQVYFLKDYLRNNGLPDAFKGWINTGFITGVTSDGRTLVGFGAGPTTFQGYIVVLPDRGKR